MQRTIPCRFRAFRVQNVREAARPQKYTFRAAKTFLHGSRPKAV